MIEAVNEGISEHSQRFRLSTITSAAAIALMALLGSGGSIFCAYLFWMGSGARAQLSLLGSACLLIALVFAYATWRVGSRMLNVRGIRLIDDCTVDVITRSGRVLRAKLPQDIEQLIRVGNDLTVHFKIDGTRVIISPEEFSRGEVIQRWLEHGLSR